MQEMNLIPLSAPVDPATGISAALPAQNSRAITAMIDLQKSGGYRMTKSDKYGGVLVGLCAGWPVISHIQLTDLRGNEVEEVGGAVGFELSQAGTYRLTFNSTIDPEQQPLNSIEIHWEDGNCQTIKQFIYKQKRKE